MIELFKEWYRRYLSDPQAVLLLVLLVAGFTVVLTMGDMLAPVLAALVIAYLLESLVRILERYGLSRLVSVIVVWLVFVAFLVFLVFGMLPLLTKQITEFGPAVQKYWSETQTYLMSLPEKYSSISVEQMQNITRDLEGLVKSSGKKFFSSMSFQSVTTGVIAIIIYFILLPLLVFFFLKDKVLILSWLSGLLPQDRAFASQIWEEMDKQLGNYIRGKIWEILIVGSVTYIVFAAFGLDYAFLLAVLVGLSVLIPYVGATIVTIPVAVVAYFQWGAGSTFVWLMVAYLIIQALDGNLLVPLLFGGVVNLHPIAIIVSILVFGGLWGFWGVFFAIPLGTLVNALLRTWPKVIEKPPEEDQELQPQ